MTPITWIDVSDDAIKIGFGVIVGGLFSLLLLWRTHRHEIQKEHFRRRQDALEAIVTEFEVFHLTLVDAVVEGYALSNAIHAAGESSEKNPQALTKKLNDLLLSSKKLSGIQARLLLMGLNESAKILNEYLGQVEKVRKASVAHIENHDSPELDDEMEKSKDIRLRFYFSLKSAYLPPN